MYSVFNGYNITTVQLIIYLSGEKKSFSFKKRVIVKTVSLIFIRLTLICIKNLML